MVSKQLLCLFLLILLLNSSISMSLFHKYPLNYSSKRNLFKVLSEVRSKIESGGALSSVLQLLTDLKTEVQNEQSSHDSVAKEQQFQCETELSFRAKEISDANTALSSANSQLTSCKNSLVRAQADLSNNVLSQQSLTEQKTQMISLREQEKNTYLQRVQDHQEALDSIEIALDLLDEIFSGEESFVQLSTLSTKMLKNAIKIKATRQYAAIISIFAQIAGRKVAADSVALEKVRQLLESLKENVENSLGSYQTEESEAVEAYEQRLEDLDQSFEELQDTEALLREQIDSFENCVAIQQGIVSSASSKLERNSEILAETQTMCDNFVQEYEDCTAKRFFYNSDF